MAEEEETRLDGPGGKADPSARRSEATRRDLLLAFFEACRESAEAYQRCFGLTLLALTFVMSLMAYNNTMRNPDSTGNDTSSARATLVNITRSLIQTAGEMLKSATNGSRHGKMW